MFWHDTYLYYYICACIYCNCLHHHTTGYTVSAVCTQINASELLIESLHRYWPFIVHNKIGGSTSIMWKTTNDTLSQDWWKYRLKWNSVRTRIWARVCVCCARVRQTWAQNETRLFQFAYNHVHIIIILLSFRGGYLLIISQVFWSNS